MAKRTNDNSLAASVENFERFDQAVRAEEILNAVIQNDEEVDVDTARRMGRKIGVDDARRARPVIDPDTGRTASRVLFVTSDTSVLDPESELRQAYEASAAYFDELHVLVLCEGKGEAETNRIAHNIWFYKAYAKYWWWRPFAATKVAKDTLIFNGVARPDFVVGMNPFEAGFAALRIAEAFVRPIQIHIDGDIDAPHGKAPTGANRWRVRLAHYVLNRVASVRVTTDALKKKISAEFEDIHDLALLPKFYNYRAFLEGGTKTDIHEKYEGYVFLILTHAPLTADSPLHDVMDSLRAVLRNPRVGLVVLGRGPAKSFFKERAELLGIARNVIFAEQNIDEIAHYKTADCFVEAGVDRESDKRVLRATAAGLPVVAYTTDLRTELFTDGESAFLCETNDSICLGQKMNKFLNNPSLHHQFRIAAQSIARDRLIEDPDQYYRTYRDSIETVLETVEPEVDAAEARRRRSVDEEEGISYPSETVYTGSEPAQA